MLDNPLSYDTSLTDLPWDRWLEKARLIADDDGYVEALGNKHAAVFVEETPTLLVTFESFHKMKIQSPKTHPFGWNMVKALGWSHLCLLCNGDTWFRDEHVFRYIDRLVDDGFFEDFEQVIFYGAGPCGYAAAAFSVAAPGAKVVLLEPQATLDTQMAEWDDRFPSMRRTSFRTRYAYAPNMIEAASEAFVLYDPLIREDAMHAALFERSHVTRFPMRHLGGTLEDGLSRMNILLRILAQVSAEKLCRRSLAALFRARRYDTGYQFRLLQKVLAKARPRLTLLLTNRVLEQREARPFRKAQSRALKKLNADSE